MEQPDFFIDLDFRPSFGKVFTCCGLLHNQKINVFEINKTLQGAVAWLVVCLLCMQVVQRSPSRLTDRSDMTSAVYHGGKASNQTNKQY